VQLNERLGQFIGLVEYGRTPDATARLRAHRLALFTDSLSRPEPPSRITQEEIGALTGISRQNANQSLKRLEREGLLRLEYGGVTISISSAAQLWRVTLSAIGLLGTPACGATPPASDSVPESDASPERTCRRTCSRNMGETFSAKRAATTCVPGLGGAGLAELGQAPVSTASGSRCGRRWESLRAGSIAASGSPRPSECNPRTWRDGRVAAIERQAESGAETPSGK